MAIIALFEVPGMNKQQYDDAMTKLGQVGQSAPKGRTYHVAGPREGGWLVLDIWDDPAALDDFAKTLMPILGDVGVSPSAPQIIPVHNIVQE